MDNFFKGWPECESWLIIIIILLIAKVIFHFSRYVLGHFSSYYEQKSQFPFLNSTDSRILQKF